MSVAQQTVKAAGVATVVNYVMYCTWTLANKWQFMSLENGGLGMDTPMLATSFQMISAGGFAAIFVLGFGIQRQPQSRYFSAEVLKTRIIPLGLSRAIDIGLGNFALVLVSVSLQQVVKSLLPVFVSVLTVTILKKHVARAVWWSLVPIMFGCGLATIQSSHPSSSHVGSGNTVPSSHPTNSPARSHHLAFIGLLLAIGSCVGRAFKAVLNAKMLHTRSGDNLKPLEILLMEAPTTGLMLIPPALMLGEGTILLNHLWEAAAATPHGGGASIPPTADPTEPSQIFLVHSVMGLVVGLWRSFTSSSAFWYNVALGVLMFFNQTSYITIIEQTSALTCQVLMNVKMLILIMISVHIFHTDLSFINYCGILVATAGVFLYGKVSVGPRKEFVEKPPEGIV